MHNFVKDGCRIFARKGTQLFLHKPLSNLWEITYLERLFLDMPILAEEELHDAAMAKESTDGGLDGWARNEVKALSLSWFPVLRQIETAGKWPQGLLDACVGMIPEALLCILPVVYRS